MKKSIWAVIILALCCVFALSGCDKGTDRPADSGNSGQQTVESNDERQTTDKSHDHQTTDKSDDQQTTDNNETEKPSEGNTECQHSLGNWIQSKAPTCADKGEEKRSCAKCDYVETREIAMIDHEFVDNVCKNCGQRKPSEGLKYTFDSDSGCYYVSRGDCTDADVVIPPTYNGKPVKGIISFYSMKSLTSITIPNSVTYIGDRAFYGCEGLTSITIPDSVTGIGREAFHGCTGLTSITIPDSVTSIGDMAFYECTGLTSITIPNSVTSIGRWAFEYSAYYDNTDNWVDGVLYIDNHLIDAQDDQLPANYTIKSGTRCIADFAFYEYSGLASITIPDSVASIGNDAFRFCTGLTNVTIGNGVTSIGENAFAGCTILTSITIGNGITGIGKNAFGGCIVLTSIDFQGTQAQWDAINKYEDYFRVLDWNNNTGAYKIYCTDGTISK